MRVGPRKTDWGGQESDQSRFDCVLRRLPSLCRAGGYDLDMKSVEPPTIAQHSVRFVSRRGATFLVALAVSVGSVTFACGSSEDAPGAQCDGSSCDAGSESSTADAPTADTSIIEGGEAGDAEASVPVACGDGGAAGSLDESFGDRGLVWLKYPGGQAFAIAAQADGKLVVAGGTSPKKHALVRLLADGSLDSSFGTAGLVETTTLSIDTQPLRAVVIQSDGKIVAAGPAIGPGPTSYDFVVLRYNTNGMLDSTFGSAGAVVTDFGNTDDYPRSIALQADGRILVAGQSQTNAMLATQNFNVARYNIDGSMDTTFGTGGKVTVDVQATPDVGGHVAVLPTGKIVLVGQSGTVSGGSPYQMSAVRLNSDGSVDTTFGSAGKMVTGFGGGGDQRANGVIVDAAGRLLLSGVFSTGSSPEDFGVLRLIGNGTSDPAFGDGGLVSTDFAGRSDAIGSTLAQQDGKVVAVGVSFVGSGTFNIAAARYLPDGRLDPTFGTGGRSLLPPPADSDLGVERAAMTGCTFVTVGTWTYDLNTLNAKPAMGIARFHR